MNVNEHERKMGGFCTFHNLKNCMVQTGTDDVLG